MLGIATLAVCGLAISGDGDWPGIAFAVAVWAAITCWPLLTGPLAHWVASLVFGPICAGAGATISFFVPIFAGLDMEDRIGEGPARSMQFNTLEESLVMSQTEVPMDQHFY